VIWANLIKFGQNQNLASPKMFDLRRLCACHKAKQLLIALHVSDLAGTRFELQSSRVYEARVFTTQPS